MNKPRRSGLIIFPVYDLPVFTYDKTNFLKRPEPDHHLSKSRDKDQNPGPHSFYEALF